MKFINPHVRTSRKTAAYLATLLAFGLAPVSLASSAAATAGDPASSVCSTTKSTGHPSSTQIKFTVAISCSRDFYKMENGLTIQRGNTTVGHPTKTCMGTSGNPIRNCSFSVTYDDPAGSQRWQLTDEYYYQFTPYDTAGLSGIWWVVTYS